MKVLVSACLLGQTCKYSGGDNFNPKVLDFLKDKEYTAVCPEVLGGLPVPRPPAEIQGGSAADILQGKGKVMNGTGQDNTAAFIAGAEKTLELAKDLGIELALLKEGSPSCGVHRIYDGTFSHQTRPGQGVTAALLKEKGIAVISEEDL